MEKIKLNCKIVGVGKRFHEGYESILEFMIKHDIISINSICRMSNEPIILAGQTFVPIDLDNFLKKSEKNDFVLNLLPSHLKDKINIDLLKKNENVLTETPYARRPGIAKKLKNLINKHGSYVLMENANFHPIFFL